jgi:hypothetical protein
MSLFYNEGENNISGMITSILLCSLGAFLGFRDGSWWSVILGVICVLGVICNFIIMFRNRS